MEKQEFQRVNAILEHKKYKECMEAIKECEKERIFCRHDMSHFLDVARIAYIISLEEEIPVSKEIIYTAAIVHDIGRHIQYLEQIPHEQAALPIAADILKACGYSEEEINQIIEAVANHRNESVKEQRDLTGLLYRADKLSRCCFACNAKEECHKSEEKRRMRL